MAPDGDDRNVAFSIVRRAPDARSKAIVRMAAAARSHSVESDRATPPAALLRSRESASGMLP